MPHLSVTTSLAPHLDDTKQATFGQDTGGAVALVDATAVTALEVLATAKPADLFAAKLTFTGGTPTTPTATIEARKVGGAYAKVFPDAANWAVVGGQELSFTLPLRVPAGSDYRVRVTATLAGGASVTVTSLSKITRG